MIQSMNRRTLLKSAGVGAAGLAATGAVSLNTLHSVARAAAQDGPVSIEYWHRAGFAEEAMQTLTEMFNTEFADEIEVTQIYQGGIQELNQKVRAAAAGGGLPGALMGDDYDISQYAVNEIITPLDDYLNDPEVGMTEDERNDILPNQLYRHQLEIYDGQMMAFPQGFSAFTCWWNVEALEAAGFDGPPATWTDFPDMARAISEANPGMAAWIFGGAGDRFISVLKTYGQEWLKEGGEESNFDAPEALEIMTWFRELSDEGLLAVTTDSARDIFVAQQSAFFMDSSANVTGLAMSEPAFAYDATLPPQGPNVAEPITETYGPINCIPTTDPEQQLAGWVWLKWLLGTEAQAVWIQGTSYFPAAQSAVQSEELSEFYSQYPVAEKLYSEVAPYATILAPSPALTEVRGQITANAVNEVLLGRLSPEEGVQFLKSEADAAIRRALGM